MHKRVPHIVDLFFVFCLFCAFALSSVTLIALGADLYRENGAAFEANFSARTSNMYITEKIRQNDLGAGVRTETLQGADALVLEAVIDAQKYETWIYCDGAELKETFIFFGEDIEKGDGQSLMPLKELSFTAEDGALKIESVDNADNKTVSWVYVEALRKRADGK